MTQTNHTASPVIVALDFATAQAAEAFAERIHPQQARLKVGKELFTHAGPDLVRRLQQRGFEIFLDLKFHDIPNTVAKAVSAAADLGVWMVNVHASGGQRMMMAAKEALIAQGHSTKLTAVTVLTSMTAEDLLGIGITRTPKEHVLALARLAADSGVDGVVCSAEEAGLLRAAHARNFCLVTPGIRPAGSAQDDQRRIMTPTDALKAGSDYLVIGRPITQSVNPIATLNEINQHIVEMENGA